MKPWLKPLFVGIYLGESNQTPRFLNGGGEVDFATIHSTSSFPGFGFAFRQITGVQIHKPIQANPQHPARKWVGLFFKGTPFSFFSPRPRSGVQISTPIQSNRDMLPWHWNRFRTSTRSARGRRAASPPSRRSWEASASPSPWTSWSCRPGSSARHEKGGWRYNKQHM